MKAVQDALKPTGIPAYATAWKPTAAHKTAPDKYQCYTEMRQAARDEFDKGCDLPKITLTVDFINTAETEEYRDYALLQNIYLGDAVKVIAPKIGIAVSLRLTQYMAICVQQKRKGQTTMTKNEIISTIKETAAKHGFTTEESSWYRWPNITEQGTHYLNFTITDEYAEDTDWSKREVTMNLHFQASLASMGGNPTPEDLIRAAEIIREGALLVQELEAMNLSYTERF